MSRTVQFIHRCLLSVLVFGVCSAPYPVQAQVPRVLPAEEMPNDRRLGAPLTLNGYFPFAPPESAEAWKHQSAQLRKRVLVATGLWPMPVAEPLDPVIHGKIDRGDYTVERVYFESVPGHYVTGSLYRPKDSGPNSSPTGRRPAVLTPHGHWSNGRFYDAGPDQVRQSIAGGAERFVTGGRYPLQARCVQLARMGCVVFHYDMIGYADSLQIQHRPGVRTQMNTDTDWGFFSPRAELRLQNMMGLQTFNSIRALDFLSALPDVDPDRIAVTGASGGGTQTFILSAIDDRPAVAFPAVMVSTAMQGGCTCENAPLLRVDSGNIHIAALTAPRPLGMTAADDWTLEMPTKGGPELAALYRLLEVPDRVKVFPFLHFGHNYNSVSRTAMYGWLNKHLDLGFDEPILEEDYEPLSREEMTVWTDGHPAPAGDQFGAEHERAVLRWLTDDAARQLEAVNPVDRTSLNQYRELVGGALEIQIGRTLADAGPVQWDIATKTETEEFLLMTGLLTDTNRQEQLPAAFLYPKKNWNREVVVWTERNGKNGLFSRWREPKEPVRRLVNAGFAVVGVDLFLQGEFLDNNEVVHENPMVDNGSAPWQQFAGYTYGYNHSLFARRVHDILTTIAFVKSDEHQPDAIHLVGAFGTGHWVAAARALAGDAVEKTALDVSGFSFSEIKRVNHPDFLPGAVKYGDLVGIIALAAPHPIRLNGAPLTLGDPIAAAYEAASAADKLVRFQSGARTFENLVATWLTE